VVVSSTRRSATVTLTLHDALPICSGVRMEGLDPPWVAQLDPKTSASTNFATSAGLFRLSLPRNRCRFIQGLASKMDGKVMEYCQDRKSTRLNSSHVKNSYAVFCL